MYAGKCCIEAGGLSILPVFSSFVGVARMTCLKGWVMFRCDHFAISTCLYVLDVDTYLSHTYGLRLLCVGVSAAE